MDSTEVIKDILKVLWNCASFCEWLHPEQHDASSRECYFMAKELEVERLLDIRKDSIEQRQFLTLLARSADEIRGSGYHFVASKTDAFAAESFLLRGENANKKDSAYALIN